VAARQVLRRAVNENPVILRSEPRRPASSSWVFGSSDLVDSDKCSDQEDDLLANMVGVTRHGWVPLGRSGNAKLDTLSSWQQMIRIMMAAVW
jgi:hypothetical protein